MAIGKILIVDDDENICTLLELYLNKASFSTSVCHNGADALRLLASEPHDLVLLDVMMPEMDGYETLKQLRAFSDVPVIMLSAKGESSDKICGLNAGADDYVAKPFEPQELISRIHAVFRRFNPASQTPTHPDLEYDNLFVSLRNYVVRLDGTSVDMTPKEIELLYYLASHPMQVYTREQLLSAVWGSTHRGDARTVDVHVKRIREKLGSGVHWRLNTVWGVGYKFEFTE